MFIPLSVLLLCLLSQFPMTSVGFSLHVVPIWQNKIRTLCGACRHAGQANKTAFLDESRHYCCYQCPRVAGEGDASRFALCSDVLYVLRASGPCTTLGFLLS